MLAKRNWVVFGLTLLLSALPVWGQATPEAPSRALLKAIPADAWGFLAVRSLEGLNKEILALAQKLQLPIGPGGLIESPLAAAKAQFGLDMGMDDKGGLAVVVLGGENFDDLSKQIVLLVPSKDVKALAEPLGAEDAGDNLLKANLFQQQVLIGAKDGFAVVVPVQAGAAAPGGAQGASEEAINQAKKIVQAVVQAKEGIGAKMDKASLADFAKNDIYLWANLDPIVKLAKPMLEGFLALAQTMAGPAQQAQMQMGFGQLLKYADQASTASIGVDLTNSGLGLNVFVSAKPDTEFAKVISGAKGTTKSLLVGLPDETFVFAGGQRVDPAQMELGTQNLTQVLDLMLGSDEIKEKVDAEKVGSFKAKVIDLVKLGGELFSFTISTLPAGPDGLIGAALVIEGADSAKAQALIGEIVNVAKEMVTDEQIKEALDVVEYKANAEKLGDARVDHIVLKLDDVSEVSAEDVAIVKKIVGQEGILVRVIAASPKHLAVVFGGGADRAKNVVNVCKTGGAPLGDRAGVKRVNTQLPKQRHTEFYLAIDAGLDLIKAIAREVGEDEIPFMLPKLDAPVAFVGSGGPGYGRYDLFLPIELIQAVAQAAMQSMFMGGGAPAPAGT